MLEQMEKYVQSVVPDSMPQRKRDPCMISCFAIF